MNALLGSFWYNVRKELDDNAGTSRLSSYYNIKEHPGANHLEKVYFGNDDAGW